MENPYWYWLWRNSKDRPPILVRFAKNSGALAEILLRGGEWTPHRGADQGIHFGEPGFDHIPPDEAAQVEAEYLSVVATA